MDLDFIAAVRVEIWIENNAEIDVSDCACSRLMVERGAKRLACGNRVRLLEREKNWVRPGTSICRQGRAIGPETTAQIPVLVETVNDPSGASATGLKVAKSITPADQAIKKASCRPGHLRRRPP